MTRTVAVSFLFLLSLAPNAFAQTADLNIIADHLSRQIPAGTPMQMSFTLLNSGPEVARGIKLTVDIPPGVTLDRIYGDGTTCDYSGLPLRCQVSDISPFENFVRYFAITMHAERVPASYTITATFAAETPDHNPGNNAVSAVFDNVLVPPSAELNVTLGPSVARVDPGESHQFTASVVSFSQTASPTNVRLELDAAGATIENIETQIPLWSCTIDGGHALCIANTLIDSCRCSGNVYVTVRAAADRQGTEIGVRARVSSDLLDPYPDDNAKEASLETYRWLAVTTTADHGPGSLRARIEEANTSCLDHPCKLVFEIPGPVPDEGWFTLTPSSPLPAMTANRLFLDAQRQTAFTGDTNRRGPEIAIDGRLAHRGVEIHSPCEAVIRGLAIGNFDENEGLWFTASGRCPRASVVDRRTVEQNYIGIDPSGSVAWPNRRGVRADFGSGLISGNVISGNQNSGIWMWSTAAPLLVRENRIGTAPDGTTPMPNGASGIFVGPFATATIIGNTISFNREMGVALASGLRTAQISGNSMVDNGGLGIDWGLDSVSPTDRDDANLETNAPVLHLAQYDAANDRTIVTLSWRTRPLAVAFGNFYAFELFSNRNADGDGETRLSGVPLPGPPGPFPLDGTPFQLGVAGDQRGKWINATAQRHWEVVFAKPPDVTTNDVSSDTTITSELSNAVLVN